MIALFFEVLPRPGQEDTYFQMAAKLKPALDASGGLVFLDRSRSAARPGWFLSHQFWADEASMVRWRLHPAHHRAQACGRADVLADYRLRVALVVASATDDSLAPAAPSLADGRLMLSVISTSPIASPSGETFASVYDTALHIAAVPVATAVEGVAYIDRARTDPAVKAARLCRVVRDYGMYTRAEAPQYFPPVTAT